MYTNYISFTASLIFVGIPPPVIQGPSEVIFQPNEGPIELVCERNTTAGSTWWRVNDSKTVTPTEIADVFPGHTVNGINIVIVNATNNTEYVCVSVVDGMDDTDSEPVYIYVAGMLYHYNKYMYKYICTCNCHR